MSEKLDAYLKTKIESEILDEMIAELPKYVMNATHSIVGDLIDHNGVNSETHKILSEMHQHLTSFDFTCKRLCELLGSLGGEALKSMGENEEVVDDK